MVNVFSQNSKWCHEILQNMQKRVQTIFLTLICSVLCANLAYARVQLTTTMLNDGMSKGLSLQQINEYAARANDISHFNELCNTGQSSVPMMTPAAATQMRQLNHVASVATNQVLNACQNSTSQSNVAQCQFRSPPLGRPVHHVRYPEQYLMPRYVGSRYCVGLVQKAVPEVGQTKNWLRGYSLEEMAQKGIYLPNGTPIAIFNAAGGTKYSGRGSGVNHAGLFNGFLEDGSGFKIIHQYPGRTPFEERFLWSEAGKKPYKQGRTYYTIHVDDSANSYLASK